MYRKKADRIVPIWDCIYFRNTKRAEKRGSVIRARTHLVTHRPLFSAGYNSLRAGKLFISNVASFLASWYTDGHEFRNLKQSLYSTTVCVNRTFGRLNRFVWSVFQSHCRQRDNSFIRLNKSWYVFEMVKICNISQY